MERNYFSDTRIGLVEQGAAVEWHSGRDIYYGLEDNATSLHHGATTRLMSQRNHDEDSCQGKIDRECRTNSEYLRK